MTTTLTVHAGEDVAEMGDIAGVVASLPMSYRRDTNDGQVVAISGHSGWTARSLNAIMDGARGVVVVNPVAESSATLAGVAQERRVPVVIDWPMACNPMVPCAATRFAELGTRESLLESRFLVSSGTDLDRVVLDQLALIAAVTAPVGKMALINRNAHGYVFRGSLSTGQPVLISAVTSTAQPEFGWLRQLAIAAAVELTLPSPVSARPARLIATTVDGAILAPTIYETSHRSTWRRIHELVDHGQVAPDLDRLHHNIRVIQAATQLRAPGQLGSRT
jgi:hypothetical protein